MATKILKVQLTPEQERILEARASAEGFQHKAPYVRWLLFTSHTTIQKVEEIHDKICR